MAQSEEELKSLLTKVKELSEKAGLKFSIQKTKIMVSGSITSWQIGGGWGMETVTYSIFLDSNGDCSHEIKTRVPWKKCYDKSRQHIQKQRQHLAKKVCLVKDMFFFFSQ